MPVDLRVSGVDDLERIAAEIKETGDRGLRKDLLRGINRALKPAKAAVKEAARRELPHHGGLDEFVASSRIGSSTRSSGRNPGVRLTGKKSGHDLRAIDRGRLRHPVFGNRNAWVTQEVKPGWWSQTLQEQAPEVRHEVVSALDEVARRLANG